MQVPSTCHPFRRRRNGNCRNPRTERGDTGL